MVFSDLGGFCKNAIFLAYFSENYPFFNRENTRWWLKQREYVVVVASHTDTAAPPPPQTVAGSISVAERVSDRERIREREGGRGSVNEVRGGGSSSSDGGWLGGWLYLGG